MNKLTFKHLLYFFIGTIAFSCNSTSTPAEEENQELLQLMPIWTDNLLQEIRATGQDTMDDDIIQTVCQVPLSILKTPRLLSIASIRDEEMSRTYTQMMIEPVQLCDTLTNFLGVDNGLDTLLRRQFFEATLTLVSNPQRLIPIANDFIPSLKIVHFGEADFSIFDKRTQSYAPANSQYLDNFSTQNIKDLAHSELVVVTITDEIFNDNFYKKIEQLNQETNVILINFGGVFNLKKLNPKQTILQIYEKNEITEDLAAQLIFGAMKAKGQLPTHISDAFSYGTGDTATAITRLKYTLPEDANVNSVRLYKGIEKVVARAIRKKAIPGCQILVAKSGKVIFNQSFGHFTYDKKTSVTNDNIYDLASITKVAATTLALMRLHEEGQIEDINDRLSAYLDAETAEGKRSRIKDLRLRYLMTHRSGLPVGFPIIQYVRLKNRTSGDYLNYFSKEEKNNFSIQITDNLFMNANLQTDVWEDIQRSRLKRKGRFKYSDVNFFVLQKVIEKLTQQSLDEYVSQSFYQPLNLNTLTYKPLEHFEKERIVPTEVDKKWRDQLLQGTVHDEAAAFFGGVGGHAGLFGRTEDLAILGQMLLNDGTYGNQRFFKKETLDFFISSKHGNHRGLGFDRKTKNGPGYYNGSSKASYGHNGYTGTCFWVDPEADLVYIFLSNRVHPKKDNDKLMQLKTREKVHRAIYKAFF
jgi:CubicO group peptidase (beta-lactamase class C family)